MFLFCSLDFFRPRGKFVFKVEIAKIPPPPIFAGRLRSSNGLLDDLPVLRSHEELPVSIPDVMRNLFAVA